MIAALRRLLSRHGHVNWALSDQAIVSGTNFLTGILLARFLGAHEFGRFTLAWMAILFAASLQHAVINAPMMSIGPKQSEGDAPAYYGAVFVQQAVFAVLSFAMILAGTRVSALVFPEWAVDDLALPLACVAAAFQTQDFLRRYFFTRGRAAMAFSNDAVSYLGQLALLVALFLFATPSTVAVLWIIGGTSAFAVIVGVLRLGPLAWDGRGFVTTSLRHWRFSKWLAMSALLQWTSGNFFLIAAASMLGATAVGGFRAAQNIIGVTHVLFQGLENIVPSQASRHFHDEGAAGLGAYLRRVAWYGGGVTGILVLMVAVAPGFWLRLVYGEEFAVYAEVLFWLALCYLVFFVSLPLRSGLRALESTKPIFVSYVLATVFSLALAYPMVGWFGLNGVVLGMLLSQLIIQAVLWRALIRGLRDCPG